eukprot:669861-Alexandrium_andersonii.AAC.1
MKTAPKRAAATRAPGARGGCGDARGLTKGARRRTHAHFPRGLRAPTAAGPVDPKPLGGRTRTECVGNGPEERAQSAAQT